MPMISAEDDKNKNGMKSESEKGAQTDISNLQHVTITSFPSTYLIPSLHFPVLAWLAVTS